MSDLQLNEFHSLKCTQLRQSCPLHECSALLHNCRMGDFEWSDVRVLLALERHKHMAEAGRALGVNATTILRRIGAMERSLGCSLFHHGSNGWLVTPAGARLLPMAQSMELNAASIQRAAAVEMTTISGVVRISAPEALASAFLVPLLAQLRARFPEVAIELSATNQLVNLPRREADIAFRLNRPNEPSVMARRLLQVTSSLVAAPSYLAARGAPTTQNAELHDFVWDGEAFADSLEGRWFAKHTSKGKVVFRSNSTHARAAAAEAGLGIAFLPRYLIGVRAERLERITTLPELMPRELWLVVHRESKRQLPVRAISVALSELVKANRTKVDV
jgi:DNA-binding transcriptional LysR family regulator